MVLWGHTKGLLGILEEVLLIGGVTATGGSNLVLDCVQHLDIQHLELWTQNEEQRAYRKVSDQVNVSSSLLLLSSPLLVCLCYFSLTKVQMKAK